MERIESRISARHSIALFVVAIVLGGCASTSLQPFELLSTGNLHFPEAAKVDGIDSGLVVVNYDVLVDGSVAELRVVSADPIGYFEEEAIRFVRTWKFRPAIQDGVAVPSSGVESTIRFELEE